jgi:HK97 family phage major capsid protein
MNEVQNYLDNLVTARQRAWNEAKELLDVATGEGREFSGEEQQKWERINADLDQKDEQIRSFRDRLDRERENGQIREIVAPFIQPAKSDDHGPSADELQREQLRAVLSGESRQGVDIDIAAAAAVKDMVRSGMDVREARDLVKATTTAGGHTVPTSLATQLYDYLEAFSGLRQTGVTVITRSSGEAFDLPTVTSHGTAAVVGEGTAAAEADPAFGKVTLTFYKYAQLLQVSSELLTDSAVDITSFIARDMGRALGRVTSNAYLNGSGTNAPTGALVVMGTATTIQTGSTGVPSYANLVDIAYGVNDAYLANGGSWLMRQAMSAAIRKLTDTSGQPLWQPTVAAGQPDTLLGFPVYHDQFMGAVGTAASTAIAFGDWSAFVIGQVGTVNIAASTDFAFSSDLTTYRATIRTGSNLPDLTGAIKKAIEPTT